LVNKVDGTISNESDIDTNTDLADHPENYVLLQCQDSDCPNTQGYVISNEKAFAFVYEKEATSASNNEYKTADENCGAGSYGKLVSDNSGICISTGKKMDFNSSQAVYMMMKGVGVAGTPFENKYDILPLKRSTSYIIRDQFYTNGKKLY